MKTIEASGPAHDGAAWPGEPGADSFPGSHVDAGPDNGRPVGLRPPIRAGGGRALAVLLLLAAACGAPARKKDAPVFFPPSPELPRIQYLTAFNGSKDVETQSAFDRFVVGEKQNVKLDKPYGVGIFDGKIYVCDTNATVVVFDLRKKTFGYMKGAVGSGKLVQPVNISIEDDGTKYVADPGRGQIVVFDRNDEYVKAYGTPGSWRPVDAVPYQDRVYVADPTNAVVHVFDKQSGDEVKTIGDKGERSERLDRPTNLAFDGEGYLYISDIGRFQVVKFDRDGHLKSTIGKPGDGLGTFARPKGVALDREGHLYAVDASFNNVQIFSKDGRLLMFFAGMVQGPGSLLLPAKVTIDYNNIQYFRDYAGPGFEIEYLVLVTSQFGDRLVNVFAFGHDKGKKYPTDAELQKLIEERREKEQAKQPKP